MIIGLDAAPPKLIYREYKDQLPNISRLIDEGSKAEMRSTHPPITIPAWISMMTGKTPGELGLYGFRHRKPGEYLDYYIANSRMVKDEALWDTIGKKHLRSIVVGIPPSYPPKKINGYMISCFITPSHKNQYTYPINLKRTIERKFGPYIFDVIFRVEKRDKVKRELWKMTEYHFEVLKYLAEKKWNLFAFVEIGVDRVQHAFWGYMDKEHRKYIPGNRYEKTILEYYKLIDEKIGELMERTPKNTVIMIVSDHGAKRMKGAFCINQWLTEKGYLKISKEPPQGTPLNKAEIEWRKTYAWGWGGYYARIFLNLERREKHGIIKREDYEHYRDELAERIKRIRGPNGEEWQTKVYKPEELYPEVRGNPPDLIVYLDDLYWRSAGTLGWKTKYLPENDRGPDDAVHDWKGILILYDPEGRIELKKEEISIREIRRIALKALEMDE